MQVTNHEWSRNSLVEGMIETPLVAVPVFRIYYDTCTGCPGDGNDHARSKWDEQGSTIFVGAWPALLIVPALSV
jgi:hypothetical protein